MSQESTLDLAAAGRLLKLGRRGPQRSVDLLLDELNRGPGRFEMLITQGPLGSVRGQQLIDGRLDLEDLTECKKLCQSNVARGDLHNHMACSATYFACLAAALVHHGRKLTRQSEDRVSEVFDDLAAVAPEPWLTLFLGAAEMLRSDPN